MNYWWEIQTTTRDPEKSEELDVSIVIPTYGIEPALPSTIEETVRSIQPYHLSFEILIVHTPFRDSLQRMQNLEQRFAPVLRLIVERRRGYGLAFMTGFRLSRGRVIATLDADLTYPADQIGRLYSLLVESHLDFINTNRFKEHEAGAFRWQNYIGNGLLALITNTLFRTPFNDSQSGMWVFKKSIWKDLRCYGRHMEFSSEIKIEASQKHLRCAEVPVFFRRRRAGESRNSVKEGLKIALYIFAERVGLARRFSTVLRRSTTGAK